ncbi:UTP15 protein, partial [Amia calva]|nr:UTP15 protein [Amia calva]
MTSFKPTKIQTYPRLGEKVTQDTLYWKNYKTPVQIKEFGAITKIDVSPLPPYNYAITASTRIHIYGRYSQEPVKNFSRFKDTAYCGTYRCDGQLLVAGSEDASVRLFDVSGRVALRQFSGHTMYVCVSCLVCYNLLSCTHSYINPVRCAPVPGLYRTASFEDYVRCGTTSKLNPDLFITGSYDHTVKVFDARTERGVMTMDHGQPVESVLLFPSEGLLVSAGGRYLKVWDMLKGGQQLVSLKNHHKTVTCLCLSSSGQRLLSGSLDRHVKVYSTTTYKVVHSFDYASSILSVALAPDDEAVIVGMTNGVLSVKHKKHPEESVPAAGKRRRPAYRFLVKGKNYVPKQDDLLVSKPVKAHLRKYDKQLKSFQVSKALDTVLEVRGPSVWSSSWPWARDGFTSEKAIAYDDVKSRGDLCNALAGREEKSLSLLLSFLIRHVVDPRFAPVLVNVAEIILDIYVRVVGQSAVIDRQVVKLQELIEKEIDYQEELVEVLGMMDTLFATMTVRKEAAAPDRASAALEPVGQRDQLEAA